MNETKRPTTDVTSNGKTYTFQRPTAKEIVQADVLGAQLRGQAPVHSLAYALGLSDMVAALNTYVVEPKGFDFGNLFDDEITEIYTQMGEWLKTFRKPEAQSE